MIETSINEIKINPLLQNFLPSSGEVDINLGLEKRLAELKNKYEKDSCVTKKKKLTLDKFMKKRHDQITKQR